MNCFHRLEFFCVAAYRRSIVSSISDDDEIEIQLTAACRRSIVLHSNSTNRYN